MAGEKPEGRGRPSVLGAVVALLGLALLLLSFFVLKRWSKDGTASPSSRS